MKKFIPVVFLSFGGLICFAADREGISGIYDPGHLVPVDSTLKVAVGQMAPDFELPAIEGGKVRLSSFLGQKNVILTFVPAAWTPVCSAQWPGYNLMSDEFAELDAVVVGITVDNIPTLHAWTEAMEGIDFPVLSDFYPHGAVSSKFGILRSDGVAERALFIVDKKGVIRFIDVHDINVRPPLEDLFGALQAIQTSP
jgi:peroxiredoxin